LKILKNLEEMCSTEDLQNENHRGMRTWHTGALEEEEFFSGDDEATAAAVARELESSRVAAREVNEAR